MERLLASTSAIELGIAKDGADDDAGDEAAQVREVGDSGISSGHVTDKADHKHEADHDVHLSRGSKS
jgi:hypothetical protein